MGNDRLQVWQFAPVDIYMPIDGDTPPHSMRMFVVNTFANCPKTANSRKFSPAKVSRYTVYKTRGTYDQYKMRDEQE